MDSSDMRQLRRLARLYNVQPDYYDQSGKLTHSSPEGVMRVLQSLGAPLARPGDIPGALRERRLRLHQRAVEPVILVWDGLAAGLRLVIPDYHAPDAVGYHVDCESGESYDGRLTLDGAAVSHIKDVEGVRYRVARALLPIKLEYGYHALHLELNGKIFDACIIAAPSRAFQPPGAGKSWGVFLPLYALRSRRSWGAGDFTDLAKLMVWVGKLGANIVSTLPLLAAFLGDQPLEISPYSPVSRLFWNEFYIDPTQAPELKRSAAARRFLVDSDFQEQVEALRKSAHVDYRQAMALKRKVLEELARSQLSSERQAAFQQFVRSQPGLQDYGAFRAAGERLRVPWRQWPARLRDGDIQPGDYDAGAKNYHLYVQWLADQQLRSLSEKAQRHKVGLNLDLPLGVHADGYDVWRERDSFALDMHGGAPPDLYFTKGQDWGFAPLHPEALRADGYRYFIASVRHHLRYAALLRIDHVLGLHRLYWVPGAMAPRDGVFVRYRAEEFYAILSLESHRHQCRIVGENLGTVPEGVTKSMRRHNIYGMYVTQLEIKTDQQPVLGAIPDHTVASLNTHDMSMLAGFWRGLDIDDRLRLELLDGRAADEARAKLEKTKIALLDFLISQGRLDQGSCDLESIVAAFLQHLAAGPGEIMLINLEDLWGELSPQNIPGSLDQHPNWRRKARLAYEEFSVDKRIKNVLKTINRLRGTKNSGHRGTGPLA